LPRVRYLGYREELAAGWGLGRVQVIHENGTRGKMLEASADYVHALDVTPDGRLLAAGGDDGALRLWEAPGGEVVATFPAP
jgi:WD40 repeat protein